MMEIITLTLVMVSPLAKLFEKICLFKYLNICCREQVFRWNKETIPKIFEQILRKKYLEGTKKYLLKLYFNFISITTTHIHD